MKLADEQWEVLKPLIPKRPAVRTAKDARGVKPERYSGESAGCCAPALNGPTYQNGTRRIRLATVAFKNGSRAECHSR